MRRRGRALLCLLLALLCLTGCGERANPDDAAQEASAQSNTEQTAAALSETERAQETASAADTEAPADALPKVMGLTAEPGDGAVTLRWDAVPGADGYCVFRLGENGYAPYKYAQGTGKGFSGLTNGTEYVFAVAAYRLAGDTEQYGERSDDVTVVPENNTLKLSETVLVLHAGETRQLTCLLYDTPQAMYWESADPLIASVSGDGLVTANAAGRTIVRAMNGDGERQCTVWVDRTAPQPAEPPHTRYTLQADGSYTNGGSGDTALLLFTGDLMALQKQMNAAKQESGSYDFSAAFSLVAPLFAEADLVVGNLETTLSESFPYADELDKYQGVTNCNTISSYLDALRAAGFDLLVTANNHYCDSGPQGVLETLDHLDEYRFLHLGTYRDETEPRVLTAQVNGIRVGILNYNEKGTNGKIDMFSARERETMLGSYEPDRVPGDIAAARALGAEFIVVCMHYGTQNSVTVSQRQESITQYLADCGADLIVGSHPHLLQKLSQVVSADGRTVPVAYSLGNFCSSMSELTLNRYNAILRVRLRRGAEGIEIAQFDYTPCCILKSCAFGRFVTVPAAQTDGMTDEDLQQLAEAEAEIARILGTEQDGREGRFAP